MVQRGVGKGLVVIWLVGSGAAGGCSGKQRDFDESPDDADAGAEASSAGSSTSSAGKSSQAGKGGIDGGGATNGSGGGSTPVAGSATGGDGGAPDAETGGAGSAGAGGSTETCPATHQCIPATPAGWSGPVIYAPTSSLPSCPSAYPTESFNGGTSVSGDTTCRCTCNAMPTSSSCSKPTLVSYLDGSCTTSNGSSELSSNACFAAQGAGTSQKLVLAAPTAQCAAGTHAPLGSPVVGGAIRACGEAATDVGSCAAPNRTCVPKPPAATNAATCVYKAGVDDCPSGFTGAAKLIYRSYTDTRSCPGTCACSGAGGTCGANRQKFSVSGCSVASGGPTPFTSAETGACLGGDSFSSMQVSAVSVKTEPTCGGGTQSASGVVSPADAVTVCCL